MNSDTPLIITGMHRSGTSMVSRFIHHSGVDLGDNLIGADEGNKYGHFEDNEFVSFHKQVLQRVANNVWYAARPPVLTDEETERGRTIATARQTKPLWGWKDPRTCLFLDFWNRLLPNAYFLFIVRSPTASVASMLRRDREPLDDWRMNTGILDGWVIYNRECLRFHERHRDRCLLVVLEHIIKAPGPFVEMLSSRLSYRFETEKFVSLYDPAALRSDTPRYLRALPHKLAQSFWLYQTIKKHADA